MAMNVMPYISFESNAREALAFYQTIFGGTVTITTFGEYDDSLGPDAANLVMHGELDADANLIFFASDTPAGMPFNPGTRVALAIFGNEEFTMAKHYNALLDQGGTAQMPLEKAVWGDSYGSVTDRYGIEWMFNISGLNHGE